MYKKTIKWICAACEQEIPTRDEELDVGEVECTSCEAKYDVTQVQPPEEADPQAFDALLRKHCVGGHENRLKFRQRNHLLHYGLLFFFALLAFFFVGGGLVLIWKGAFGDGGLDSFWNFLKALIAGGVGFLFLWLGLWAMIGFLYGLCRSLGRTRLALENGRLLCTVYVGPFPFRRRELKVNADSNVGILLRRCQTDVEDDLEDPMTECHLFLETDGEKLDGSELWIPEEELGFIVAWIEKRGNSALGVS